MRTSHLLATLTIATLGFSSLAHAIPPSAPPSGADPLAGNQGIFAKYFSNLALGCSIPGTIMTDFKTSGADYLKPECGTIGTIMGEYFNSLGFTNTDKPIVFGANGTPVIYDFLGLSNTQVTNLANQIFGGPTNLTNINISNLTNNLFNTNVANQTFLNALNSYITNMSGLSQWKDVTGGIAYTGGTVNISNATDNGKIRLTKESGSDWNYIEFVKGASRKHWLGTNAFDGGFMIGSDIGGDFSFYHFANVNAPYLTVKPQDASLEGGEINLEGSNAGRLSAILDNANDNFRVHSSGIERFKVNLLNGALTTINASNAYSTLMHSGPAGGNTHIDTYGGAGGAYINWFAGVGGTHIGNGAGNYGNLYAANLNLMSTGSICFGGNCYNNSNIGGSTNVYDVNSDGDVNCQDVDFVRANSGLPITSANRKADLNNSNGINATDIGIIRNTVLATGIMCTPMVTWKDDGTNIYYTGGNVGIGTAVVPSEKLQVTGNILANGFLYSSDRNLKKNITPLENSLEKIMKLNGYTYNWKSTGKADMGIIAQEVETVYPDLVHTNAEGVKSVEYANLIAPLIEAVKTQQKEIEALKAEVAGLKK